MICPEVEVRSLFLVSKAKTISLRADESGVCERGVRLSDVDEALRATQPHRRLPRQRRRLRRRLESQSHQPFSQNIAQAHRQRL